MTSGEWMVQNSSLDIATAGEHLVNPECVGDGTGPVGDIYIADGIFIEEEPMVALTEYDDVISIVTEPSVPIYLEEDDIIIEIIEEDAIDVV